MNQKDDLIIGAFAGYDWNQVRYWANSIKLSGFKGHKAVIVMDADQATVKKISDEGFTTVVLGELDQSTGRYTAQKTNLAPHVERFFHIWNFLDSLEEKPRNVVVTDVRDVVFQKNPSDYMDVSLLNDNGFGFEFIAGSESMRYQDEEWGRQNFMQCFGPLFYEKFKQNTIYNVGTFAGTYQMVKEMCLNIFVMSLGRQIPIVDQAVFNFLLYQKAWAQNTLFATGLDPWCCQAGTTIDPSKITKHLPLLTEKVPRWNKKNEEICTHHGDPFFLFHQYDRTPYKEVIEKKYG